MAENTPHDESELAEEIRELLESERQKIVVKYTHLERELEDEHRKGMKRLDERERKIEELALLRAEQLISARLTAIEVWQLKKMGELKTPSTSVEHQVFTALTKAAALVGVGLLIGLIF